MIKAVGFDFLGVLGTGERINHEVAEIVGDLRSLGIKTGLISNDPGQGAIDQLYRAGIVQLFDAIHVSGETGLEKPDPEAFRNLAAALAVDISELAFIDDRQHNLSTAEATGFTPILFDSAVALRRTLMSLGAL